MFSFVHLLGCMVQSGLRGTVDSYTDSIYIRVTRNSPQGVLFGPRSVPDNLTKVMPANYFSTILLYWGFNHHNHHIMVLGRECWGDGAEEMVLGRWCWGDGAGEMVLRRWYCGDVSGGYRAEEMVLWWRCSGDRAEEMVLGRWCLRDCAEEMVLGRWCWGVNSLVLHTM